MSKVAPVLDFMGRPITAGCTVVYPVRRGSRMWMQELLLTQVVPGETPTLGGFNNEGRKITIHNTVNCVVTEPRTFPQA